MDGLEHLVPVGPARVGASLEAGDEVALRLQREKHVGGDDGFEISCCSVAPISHRSLSKFE